MKKTGVDFSLLAESLLRPAAFFLVTGAIFGLFFVITNPPGFGLDERAHFLRAYELSQGNLGAARTGQQLDAKLPQNLTQWVDESTADLLDNDNNVSIFRRHEANTQLYKPYYHEQFSSHKVNDFVSSSQLAGTYNYNPISYAHLGGAVWIGERLHLGFLYDLYLARFVNLVLYLAIVVVAIRMAPRFKWLLAMVALWPTTLFQATIVSVDPVINAVSFLLFALAVRYLYDRHETVRLRYIVLIGALASLLAITKQPYVLLALPFLFIPTRQFVSPRRAYIIKVLWLVVPLFIGLLWTKLNVHTTHQAIAEYGSTDIGSQLKMVVHHPVGFVATTLRTYFNSIDAYTAQMIGSIGDRLVGIPLTCIVLLAGLTAGLASILPSNRILKRPVAPGKLRDTGVALTVAGLVGVISLSLYLGFTPVGAPLIAGIQGRYFLPIVPFLAVLVATYLPVVATAKERVMTLIMAASSIVLLGSTAALYFVANYR